MNKKIEVSLAPQTIYILILLAVGTLVVWQLSDIIILIITAMMCAAALQPLVDWLQSQKIPRTVAAVLVIVMLVLPLVYVLIAVTPAFIEQLPTITNAMSHSLNTSNFLPPEIRNLDLSQYLQSGGTYLLESTSKVTNFFFQLTALIFMTFYLLVDGDRLHGLLSSLIPGRNRQKLENISVELAKISGQYIRGNLLISLICSLLIFTGLLLLRVPYALPLAIFAGILDLMPLIGSTIGAIPAVLIAFMISPLKGFLTIAIFILYQTFENDILAPSIYKQVLKLIPFLSFISVIIGTLLFGILGAFLALPVAAAIPTLLTYFKTNKK